MAVQFDGQNRQVYTSHTDISLKIHDTQSYHFKYVTGYLKIVKTNMLPFVTVVTKLD